MSLRPRYHEGIQWIFRIAKAWPAQANTQQQKCMPFTRFDAHKHEVIMFVQTPKSSHNSCWWWHCIEIGSSKPSHSRTNHEYCAGLVPHPLFICTLPSDLVWFATCLFVALALPAPNDDVAELSLVLCALLVCTLFYQSNKASLESDVKTTQTGQEKTSPKSVNNIRPFTNVDHVEGLNQLCNDINPTCFSQF